MIYDWLAHKMIARNVRLVRLGLKHRVWLIAFWISFAAYAVTQRPWLAYTTLALLICAATARILVRRRALHDLQKMIQVEQTRSG